MKRKIELNGIKIKREQGIVMAEIELNKANSRQIVGMCVNGDLNKKLELLRW